MSRRSQILARHHRAPQQEQTRGDELMEPHRFAGMAGIAWVFVTAIGIGLFAAAGPPPPFAEASSYANFTTASAKFFLLDAFTTGVSAALLLAFFAGLGAVFRKLDAEHLLLNTPIRGYGAASAIMLAMVGVFETVTVYVSETSAYSALTAPLWMLTQTAITFLYFFGARRRHWPRQFSTRMRCQVGQVGCACSPPCFLPSDRCSPWEGPDRWVLSDWRWCWSASSQPPSPYWF